MNDIEQIKLKGLTKQDIDNQVGNFINGFPFVEIVKSATINDGILKLSNKEVDAFAKLYDDLKPESLKFVPASGAATRMFKFLFEFYEKAKEKYNSIEEIENKEVIKFIQNISDFAFYDKLKDKIESNNIRIEELLKKGKYRDVIGFLLFEKGMNYSNKPKAVLFFHKYDNYIRTAIEEHLAEGAFYAKSDGNKVKIHFTISPEHKELFDNILFNELKKYEAKYNVKFEISYSQQKPSTDMVAVDLNNQLFRNNDGSLLFRPGGHGALIENLDELDSDIIFIKNIDNIIPDRLKGETVLYKKALAGLLISYKEKIFNYIELLKSGDYDNDSIQEINLFIENELCYKTSNKNDIESLIDILNRPIRICGMVKNEGEPGGGPFWVSHKNYTDLQIVESSQIDHDNPDKLKILNSSTHFNPVDIVCSTKDFKGDKFDLLKFRDSSTGFISKKSKDGKELKAQELPGLWNGAMANWNTAFVEVPVVTFNPVKTVNDLLRKEHKN